MLVFDKAIAPAVTPIAKAGMVLIILSSGSNLAWLGFVTSMNI
jgi:hypothetical protein